MHLASFYIVTEIKVVRARLTTAFEKESNTLESMNDFPLTSVFERSV